MTNKKIKTSRYRQMKLAAERQIIEAAIDFTDSIAAAARYLEIGRAYLYKRMEVLGIREPESAKLPVRPPPPGLIKDDPPAPPEPPDTPEPAAADNEDT